MMKMFNACTSEVDDSEAAVAEILEQLALENRLLKNSVGIIACYSEFIETGVVEALCKRLPFDVVGCTTLGNSACGSYGLELLSISVLTSDDVVFSAVMSDPISGENIIPPLTAAYNAGRQGKQPDFILVYAPLMTSLGGSVIFNGINTVTGGRPMFGSFSCDHTPQFTESRVIKNGEAAKDTVAMILMFGTVNPKFYVTAIPEKSILRHTAVITESEGTLLKRVNGVSLLEYLRTLGINNQEEVLPSVPLLINYHDGTDLVAVAMYSTTPEGYVICAGDVPVNATVSIGSMDYYGIMETARTTVGKIPNNGEINGILIYPCLSRNIALVPNTEDEMKSVFELIGGKYPYQLSYSGGEICPLFNEEGVPVNHIHNFSFALCVL
jgi:hypothetical protein